MNKFKFMIFGICAIGLVACGNEDKITVSDVETELNKISEEVNDLSEFPIGVQNGNVSPEYYNALASYFKLINDYDKDTQEIENNAKSYSNKERFQKHVILNNEKIASLNGIKHNPTSEIEKEIDEYFTKTLYYDEEMSNYKSKYYSTYDETYYDLAKTSGDSYAQSASVLNEMMKKYELFE